MSDVVNRVDVEISRAWHGSGWLWVVRIGGALADQGTEDTYTEALMAVQVTLDNTEVDAWAKS